MENLKKLLTKKVLWIAIAVIVVALILVLLFARDKGPSFTTQSLGQTLQASSDLVSAKLTIGGMADYKSEKGVKLWNYTSFKMFYKATVPAGIDIDQVKIAVNDAAKTVNVTLPEAHIFEDLINVDPNSIVPFDKNIHINHKKDMEYLVEAQKLAQTNAVDEAKASGLLELAEKQSEALVRGLLGEIVAHDGYKLIINGHASAMEMENDSTSAATTKKAA